MHANLTDQWLPEDRSKGMSGLIKRHEGLFGSNGGVRYLFDSFTGRVYQQSCKLNVNEKMSKI